MNRGHLVKIAADVRLKAYAPYSNFKVGAALRAASGEVFTGCNVENVSYGLTICAERVAIGAAVASGVTKFDQLAIISDSEEPVVPCGACRQVLAEFCPELPIVSQTVGGLTAEFSLGALFPKPRQGILG